MSPTASDATPQPRYKTLPLVVVVWAAVVAGFALRDLNAGPNYSTDDAMRLVQIRDLLAGQNWFDTTQYRLDPPEGLLMHWSRLIDAPLAGIIRLGTILGLPAARTEEIAVLIWPASMLLVFLLGVARLARELGGPLAPQFAIIFVALTAPIVHQFRYGGIDHHNAQLALLVWGLAFAVRTEVRTAVAAGICCALAVAIGQENTPAIAAIAATVGLHWVIRGNAVKDTTIAFALTFAAGTLVLFAATVAASAYTIVWCDALSIAHVSATIIGGGGLACLAASSIFNTVNRRLAGATTHGGITILALGLAFPECFGDPYLHVDPRLATLWLGNVSEAASFPTILQNKPHMVLSLYGLIVAGLAAGIYYSIRLDKDARWAWVASVIVLAPLTVMTLWQVRSGIAGNAIAIPLVAAAVVQIHSRRGEREVFLGMGRTALVLLTLCNPLSLIAIGNVTERAINAMSGRERPTEVADGPGTCVGTTDYIALQQLPRGLVAAFIDAGPFILTATSHSVLAAPYHRNFRGAGKTYDIFLSLPEVAARHLAALNVSYVALCPGAAEAQIFAEAAPEGLAADLGRGKIPTFLERIALEQTKLMVYRVVR